MLLEVPFAALAVDAGIQEYAIEPGPESGIALEAVNSTIHGNEGIVDGVLRVKSIAMKIVCERVHGAFTESVQFFESGDIALPATVEHVAGQVRQGAFPCFCDSGSHRHTGD